MSDTSKRAFPVPPDTMNAYAGMTLREYYAGMAMQGELASEADGFCLRLLSDEEMKGRARGWARAADALLAALKESAE